MELGQKGDLCLFGSIEELTASLKAHLKSGDQGHHEDDEPPEMRLCLQLEDDPLEEAEPFLFEKHGQWVAVFCDQQFCIGQVVHISNKDTAMVKYLERTSTQED